jgi:hypothetical protein
MDINGKDIQEVAVMTEFDLFNSELLKAVDKSGAKVEIWGETEGLPIYCLRLKGPGETKKRKMVTTGFHPGTENAGQWAVVEFLKDDPQRFLEEEELTILPMVNPTGFREGTRENSLGENVNRGYGENDENPITREGKILMEHIGEMVELAADGELSLHGDEDSSEGSFIYSRSEALREAEILMEILNKYFGTATTESLLAGEKISRAEDVIKPGIIVDEYDGDFGDGLYRYGIKKVLVSETPDKGVEIGKRVEANKKMIQAFCQL